MTNPDGTAFPVLINEEGCWWTEAGLTKRELFTLVVLHATVSSDVNRELTPLAAADFSRQTADTVLSELDC